MKIAIVYASETGNTAQIAQAIREGCQGHEIVAFGPLPRDVGEAELIFVGSWTDKGHLCPGGKGVFAGTPREAGGPVRHGGFWPV